jgi:hypothetical protein
MPSVIEERQPVPGVMNAHGGVTLSVSSAAEISTHGVSRMFPAMMQTITKD